MTEKKVISLETKEEFRHKLAEKEDHEFHSAHFVTFTCPQCGAKDSLMKIDPSPEAQHVYGVEKEGDWKGELFAGPFDPTYFMCSECEWVAETIADDSDMVEWLLGHQEGSLADEETEERRELLFVCPKCGNDWLQTRSERYRKVNHIYEDNSMEWGDDVGQEEVMDFLCGGCGYVLKFEGEGEFGIADLVKQHQKKGDENCNVD